MADMTIDEFCDKHGACSDGREWALANCSSMVDAWQKLPPDYLLWVATRPGVLSNRELLLFALFCARSVEHMLIDDPTKKILAVAERFANGDATKSELERAWYDTSEATRTAATRGSAETAVAAGAAWAAARSAWGQDVLFFAEKAALRAVRAALVASGEPPRSAAWVAAGDVALEKISTYLRTMTQPSFKKNW